MPSLLFVPMPETRVFLELDGLYLFAARLHLARTNPPKVRIRSLTQRLLRLNRAIPASGFSHENDEGRQDRDLPDYHDTLVEVGRNIEDTYYQLVRAFRPSWQHCAEAIILSALSIEAHMNRRIIELVTASSARKRLTKATPPHEKVQKILAHLGKKQFNKSEQVFADYVSLVRYRNNLVHYKPRLTLHDDGRPPKLPEELGLIPREAKRAVRVAEGLIESFSHRLGLDAPAWIRRDIDHFFDFA